MILFLGDSFTWGQGLHYYYMIENEGWSWDDCRNFLENNRRFETLGFQADEYRRNHGFPYLVSKELNQPLIQPRFENGGDNYNIYDILNNINLFITPNEIKKVIVQFSAPTRRIESDQEIHDTHENLIRKQIYRINEKCTQLGLEWYGIAWYKEFGEILQNEYKENHIPILYNNKKYESFDFLMNIELQDLTIQYTQNIDDGHFNKEGHQVISNSILTKIKENLYEN